MCIVNNLLLDKKTTLSKGQTAGMLAVLIGANLGEKMPSRVEKKREVESEKSQLSERDIRLLLFLCAELVNFCAKATSQMDPAIAAMLTYVRDDIRFENKSILP